MMMMKPLLGDVPVAVAVVVFLSSLLRSLRSYYVTAKTTLIKTVTLHFAYESRDTLKLFPLFITVKTITILNLEHSDNFEILAVVVHAPRTSQNLVISRCCFVEDGKEMYKEL